MIPARWARQRPVNETICGCSLAPTRQRVRPLLRAARVERLLAARDHAAVDDAGEDRRDLAGGDRDHRLVEQRQALRRRALSDASQTLDVHRDREELCVAEPLADLGGPGRGVVRGLEVARQPRLERGRDAADSHARRTLAPRARPVAAPAEPAAGRADLAADRKVHAEPERAPRGAKRSPASRNRS